VSLGGGFFQEDVKKVKEIYPVASGRPGLL
jgi:hypothetical protein